MSAKQFHFSLLESIKKDDLILIKSLFISPYDASSPIPTSSPIPVETISSSIYEPTPIILSTLYNSPQVLSYLLFTVGADISHMTGGFNAFHFAILHSPSCLSILLQTEYVQQNINTPIPNTKQTSVLHLATTNKQHQSLFLLLQPFQPVKLRLDMSVVPGCELMKCSENNVNVNQLSDSGNSALHIAATQNDFESINILVAYGADVELKNSCDQTVIDIAIRFRYNDLIEKLKEKKFSTKFEINDKYLNLKKETVQNDIVDQPNETEALRAEIRNLKTLVESLYTRVKDMETKS